MLKKTSLRRRWSFSCFAVCVTLFSLAAGRISQASTLVLLDNTSGLSLANLDPTDNFRKFVNNTSAYNEIFGYSFQVGSTAYDAVSVSLPLDWQGSGSVATSLRMFFWELPNLSADRPADGAAPFYTEELASVSVTNTPSYVTFTFSTPPLLKANTRYSVALGASLTSTPGDLYWVGIDSQAFPPAEPPSGNFGLSSAGFQSSFLSVDGGAIFRPDNQMDRNFQLTGVVAVPEPSTVALLGIALMVMAGALRWTQSRLGQVQLRMEDRTVHGTSSSVVQPQSCV